MNHVFLAREHLLVIYTETGEYKIPADHVGDKGIFDITNWPFDIMRINETNCMVFADPNFMTSMGSGFTSNGELVTGALVWRDRFLYRYGIEGELHQIADFPAPWTNLGRGFYVQNSSGELYDELMQLATTADNINDTKQYQDEFTAKAVRLMVKYKVPVQFAYSINVRTGGMSRVNRNRMKDLEQVQS